MSYQYLLDANVFIQAHRFHYPFDVFPSYWNWLEEQNDAGYITSISEIRDELFYGDDELKDWASNQDREKWFLTVDDERTQDIYGEIVNSIIDSEQWETKAIDDFLGGADPWLIAKARATNMVIVTHEKSNPNSKRKIFIPDICIQFNVQFIDNLRMLRTLEGIF